MKQLNNLVSEWSQERKAVEKAERLMGMSAG
jgi:hypothetical protein